MKHPVCEGGPLGKRLGFNLAATSSPKPTPIYIKVNNCNRQGRTARDRAGASLPPLRLGLKLRRSLALQIGAAARTYVFQKSDVRSNHSLDVISGEESPGYLAGQKH